MADLYLPRAFVAVDICLLDRALAVLSVSPMYLPWQGVEFIPAQGMWYITPFFSSFSSLSFG